MKNSSLEKSLGKKVVHWVVAPVSLALVVTAGYVSAGPHFGGGHHGMMNPLEKMVDHVDLTAAQETQVDAILDQMKHQRGMQKGFKMMTSMIALDPEAADYETRVEQHADIIASKLKEKVMAMSAARKEIYAILTPEQKLELNEEIAEKVAKMEKRMEKRMKKHERKERRSKDS